MREQIELLKNHADIVAQHIPRRGAVINCYAINGNLAGIMRLQPVDAADSRRLARPGRTANDNFLPQVNVEGHIGKRLKVPKKLVDVTHADKRITRGRGARNRPGWRG